MTLSDIVSAKHSTRSLDTHYGSGPAVSLVNRFFCTGEEVYLVGDRWTGVKTFVLRRDGNTLSESRSRDESAYSRTLGLRPMGRSERVSAKCPLLHWPKYFPCADSRTRPDDDVC